MIRILLHNTVFYARTTLPIIESYSSDNWVSPVIDNLRYYSHGQAVYHYDSEWANAIRAKLIFIIIGTWKHQA